MRACYEEVQPPGYDKYKKQHDTGTGVCGLKRRTFYIVLAAVLIVALAAVLGGVLGTRSYRKSNSKQYANLRSLLGESKALTRSRSDPSEPTNSTFSSNSSSIQAVQNSGVSLIVPAISSDETVIYSYYQSPDGSIVENEHDDDALHVASNNTIVAASAGAAKGSPLAVTSWQSNGATYRQLFFLDGDGRVLTTNTAGSQD